MTHTITTKVVFKYPMILHTLFVEGRDMKLILALILATFAIAANGQTIPVVDERGAVTTAEGRLVATDADFDIYTTKDEANYCAVPNQVHQHVLFIKVKHATGNISQVQETIVTAAHDVMTTGLWYANPGQAPVRKQLDGLRTPITTQPLFGTDIPLSQVLNGLCK